MALVEAFYKLLVAADMSAARTQDKHLEQVVEKSWREAHRAGAKRCPRALYANEQRLLCVLEAFHEEDCVFLLMVQASPEGVLRFTNATGRRLTSKHCR